MPTRILIWRTSLSATTPSPDRPVDGVRRGPAYPCAGRGSRTRRGDDHLGDGVLVTCCREMEVFAPRLPRDNAVAVRPRDSPLGYPGRLMDAASRRDAEGGPAAPATATYESATSESAPDTSAFPAHARGTAVHRYMLLERLGEGGMGVVYAAYDPTLDRRVALKFLSHESDRDGVREKRLLREAQAMARLSHPNVVVAYEVGTFQGRVFIAMEFVDGMDLRAWLAEKPRSVVQLLEVFRAAGRGLAAAHAAGIVHRDFKPENVLLDRHGRPRVTDFGLSRASRDLDDAEVEPASEPGATALSAPSHLSIALTRTGGVLGTPSYMPPEQRVGGVVDARSDQFSFCVALYEAAYGEHPFPGDAARRIENAMAGRVADCPPHSPVPRWCREALLRGLAPVPERRFASMEDLLAALSPPARRRGHIAIAASLGLILAGAGATAFVAARSEEAPAPGCDRGAERLAGVWDPARKSQLRQGFIQTGARGADVTWSSFAGIVDRRARAWAAMNDEACAATHVLGAQSAAVLDLRMECLDRKRQEMKALVDVYAEGADASSLDRAVSAADALSSISGCADIANLRALVPLPEDPAVRAKVQSIRGRLIRSRALYEAGRYEQGRAYTTAVKQEADAVGYAPLAAEASIALANHLSRMGEVNEAEKLLLEAARLAVEGRDSNQEAEAWLALLDNYIRGGRAPKLIDTATVAELAVERAHGDEAMRARLASSTGLAQLIAGNKEEALGRLERAATLWKNLLGDRSPRFAEALDNIGEALSDLGRIQEGLEHVERSLALRRAVLRPDHPDIGDSLYGASVGHLNLGHLHKARELASSSAEIRKRELGPDHPLSGRALRIVAYAEVYLGNLDRGLDLMRMVLSSRKRALDPRDMSVSMTYLAMGNIQKVAGLNDEAEGSYREALEHSARAWGHGGPIAGGALAGLGHVHNSRGLHRQALDECRRSFDMLADRFGENNPLVLTSRECLGEALLGLGDIEAARQTLERSVDAIDERGLRPQWTAGARFQLVRALWVTPDDRPRALALARATLSSLAAAEGDNRKLIARIERWLATHQEPPRRGKRAPVPAGALP
jgi:eukaryotic-like serine/threonine-protein kinase